ncbi:MAG: hypothetical protein ACI87O_003005, partial [Planctomycetota bacterium]
DQELDDRARGARQDFDLLHRFDGARDAKRAYHFLALHGSGQDSDGGFLLDLTLQPGFVLGALGLILLLAGAAQDEQSSQGQGGQGAEEGSNHRWGGVCVGNAGGGGGKSPRGRGLGPIACPMGDPCLASRLAKGL